MHNIYALSYFTQMMTRAANYVAGTKTKSRMIGYCRPGNRGLPAIWLDLDRRLATNLLWIADAYQGRPESNNVWLFRYWIRYWRLDGGCR